MQPQTSGVCPQRTNILAREGKQPLATGTSPYAELPINCLHTFLQKENAPRPVERAMQVLQARFLTMPVVKQQGSLPCEAD